MVVKIDHICYCCTVSEISETEEYFPDYDRQFMERDLPNLPIKERFFSFSHPAHTLVYLHKPGLFPIEITAYDRITYGNMPLCFDAEKQLLYLQTGDMQNTIEFFTVIGYRGGGGGLLKLITPLDKRPFIIQLKKAENEFKPHKLDNHGFCCLAFQVSNIESHRARFEEKGYGCTQIDTLVVNGTAMKICFVQGTQGEIFELIQPDKRR